MLYGVSGTGTRLDANPTESGENIGKLTVVMADGGSKQVEAQRNRAPAQQRCSRIPNAQVDFSRPELFSFSTPLEIEISGQDLDAIEHAGRQMAAMLRGNAALRRRQVDGGAGLPGNPDPLRPGSRRARWA